MNGSSLNRPSSKSSNKSVSTAPDTSTTASGSDTYTEIPARKITPSQRPSLKARKAPAPPQPRRTSKRQIPCMEGLGIIPDLVIDSTEAIYVDIDEYKQRTSGYFDEEPPQYKDLDLNNQKTPETSYDPSVQQYSYDNP